jgi:hypothetical protein
MGVTVRCTVVEQDAADRAGLAAALEVIARGEADTLVVARLASIAGSFGELMRLLDWLRQHSATLLALDVELDGASSSGRRTMAVLEEVRRWSREPEHPRRPPGRPGLSEREPDLAQRIAILRQQGLSLHAIADALNADGVPTPRGGARWRASSVQSVLGYRRPRPPGPGPGRRPGPGRGRRGPPRRPPAPGPKP